MREVLGGVEVPEGDNLAFAALENGAIELMYGSYSSLRKELGDASPPRGTVTYSSRSRIWMRLSQL